MKMYILVRESIPLGIAVNAVGHASLACFLKFASDKRMQNWLATSFKKVTCRVNDQEIQEAMISMGVSQYVHITESALGDAFVAVAFCPQEIEWPAIFKTFKLYK